MKICGRFGIRPRAWEIGVLVHDHKNAETNDTGNGSAAVLLRVSHASWVSGCSWTGNGWLNGHRFYRILR